MARLRIKALLLAAASLPVVVGSMVLSDWARVDPMTGATRNTVQNLVRFGTVSESGQAGLPATFIEPDEDLVRRCEEAVGRLAQRLCKNGEFVIRSPFVLGGNLPEAELEQRYRVTILPALRAMYSTYFAAEPDSPITILLFQDAKSYRDFSRRLLGHRNVSLYGYYRPSTRMVVINMGAGAGTIVHEMTHALIDFDFPDVPLWFNEGLASLHEECRLVNRDGQPAIEGLMNWRYRSLVEAIQSDSLPLATRSDRSRANSGRR